MNSLSGRHAVLIQPVGIYVDISWLGYRKIEEINQKIKTIRRHGYGYPDDEYFFLKLFDMSRQGYVRNTPSHRFRIEPLFV